MMNPMYFLEAKNPTRAAAGRSGRLSEDLVQDAAEWLRLGQEATVVTGELDHGRAELIGKGDRAAVGELCPLEVAPAATTMRTGVARSAWMSGR